MDYKKRSMLQYLKELNEINSKTEAEEKVKLAILRTYSTETIEKTLPVDGFDYGLSFDLKTGGYNQLAQEILNDSSWLYSYKPNYTLFLVNIEDLCPFLFKDYYSEGDIWGSISQSVEQFVELIRLAYERTKGYMLVSNFTIPSCAPQSDFNAQGIAGLNNLIRRLNVMLAEKLSSIPSAYIIDLDRILSKIGLCNAFDPRMEAVAKNPYSFTVYSELSIEISSMITAIRGIRKKCIVLDLDNTLWKGIIGEDGFNGIEINYSFQQLQKQLRYWNQTGVLLAINSKNNFSDAIDVIRNHPDMVLRECDFSALQINWNDKASNLRSIAASLNIGTDSLIFIDDSNFECELVKAELPDVTVIHLDGNFVNYPEIIKNIKGLNFIALSEEDRKRASIYSEQRNREAFMERFTDINQYLKGLEMELYIRKVEEYDLQRAAQMTQKTNQFNLTTKRYTEGDLRWLLSNGYLIFTLRVSDKFGDNGLTGLLIINATEGKVWKIDTFLLSCRVMGRKVEYGFFKKILELALHNGVKEIIGEYIPTNRNIPVKDLLENFGFCKADSYWVYHTEKVFEFNDFFVYK